MHRHEVFSRSDLSSNEKLVWLWLAEQDQPMAARAIARAVGLKIRATQRALERLINHDLISHVKFDARCVRIDVYCVKNDASCVNSDVTRVKSDAACVKNDAAKSTRNNGQGEGKPHARARGHGSHNKDIHTKSHSPIECHGHGSNGGRKPNPRQTEEQKEAVRIGDLIDHILENSDPGKQKKILAQKFKAWINDPHTHESIPSRVAEAIVYGAIEQTEIAKIMAMIDAIDAKKGVASRGAMFTKNCKELWASKGMVWKAKA